MLDFLLSPPVVPFSLALGLLAGLLVLEIAALLLGGTVFGKDTGKGELDGDVDTGLEGGFDSGLGSGAGVDAVELPPAIELAQMEMGGVELADLDLGGPDLGAAELAPDTLPGAALAGGPGLASVLGLGRVPFLIWFAAVLAGFGLSGYLLQSLISQLFGAPLPPFLAVLPAAFVGLWFARGYGRVLARLIPGTESSVRSKAMLNRKRGVVSQGTARAGLPAEVRVQDSFGNLHYIRAEPLDQREAIARGTEVLVLRVRQGPARGQFRILPLSGPEP